jgi:hypothetical protein
MGLAPALIVLLVIIGAVFAVMMGYATHRTFGFKKSEEPTQHWLSPEQDEYMRSVRTRHFQDLQDYVRSLRRYHVSLKVFPSPFSLFVFFFLSKSIGILDSNAY